MWQLHLWLWINQVDFPSNRLQNTCNLILKWMGCPAWYQMILRIKYSFLFGISQGIILVMGSANKRRCNLVMPPLIGWSNTQNDPCLRIMQIVCALQVSIQSLFLWQVLNFDHGSLGPGKVYLKKSSGKIFYICQKQVDRLMPNVIGVIGLQAAHSKMNA